VYLPSAGQNAASNKPEKKKHRDIEKGDAQHTYRPSSNKEILGPIVGRQNKSQQLIDKYASSRTLFVSQPKVCVGCCTQNGRKETCRRPYVKCKVRAGGPPRRYQRSKSHRAQPPRMQQLFLTHSSCPVQQQARSMQQLFHPM
jgi:hypothetical protein